MNWTLIIIAALSFGVGVAAGMAILGVLAAAESTYFDDPPVGGEPNYGPRAFNQLGSWGEPVWMPEDDDAA